MHLDAACFLECLSMNPLHMFAIVSAVNPTSWGVDTGGGREGGGHLAAPLAAVPKSDPR